MQTCLRVLCLILCFEFILGPYQGSLLINQAMAQTPTCPASMDYHKKLNRCLTKEQVVRVNHAVAQCSGSSNYSKCYKTNAQSALTKAKELNQVEDKDNFSQNEKGELKSAVKTANRAAMAIPLFFLTKTAFHHMQLESKEERKAFKCRPPSLLIMYAAAAALATGEVLSYFTHKKRLNDIEKEWGLISAPDSEASQDKQRTQSTTSQANAFELLARNEESIAKAAAMKQGFYIAAASLFGVGSLTAGLELVQLKMAKAALTSPDPAIKLKANETIRRLTCNTVATEIAEKDVTGKTTGQDDENQTSVADQITQMNKDVEEKFNKGIQDAFKPSDEAATQNSQAAANDAAALDAAVKNNPQPFKPLQTKFDQPNNSDSQGPAINKEANKSSPTQPKTKSTTTKNTSSTKTNTSQPSKSKTCPPGQSWHPEVQMCTLPEVKVETSCPMGKVWDAKEKRCKYVFEPKKSSIEKDNLLRIKKIALSNLKHARDMEEYFQLLHEYESLEFENFTKISYLEEDLRKELRQISVNKLFSHILTEALIGPVYADEGKDKKTPGEWTKDAVNNVGGFLGKSMNSISGIIKFQDGAPLTSAQLKNIEKTMGSKFNKAIYSPVTRIAINGLLGGWVGVMSSHFKEQKKISHARADKLREIKADFESHSGLMHCKEEDRSNTAKPQCYCYTFDNKKNPNRSNSKICQNLWASSSFSSKDYLASDEKVCVDKNFGMDASCSCKRTNTCLKVSASGLNMSGISPGVFKMLSVGSSPANSLFNGDLSAGQMDAGSIANNAAKIKKAADEILAKSSPQDVGTVAKLSDAMEKGLMASASGLAMGGSGSSGGNNLASMSPKEAVAELEKELKAKESEITFSGSNGAGPLSSDQHKSDMDFDFGLTNQASQEEAIAEVMGKDLDFGANDINSGSTTNIFEVLSNRYKRSGLRRLFDEEGKVPADKAHASDINN